jgi:hypothetical protein
MAFDYDGWVSRAVDFTRRLAGRAAIDVRAADREPALSVAAVNELERALGRTLPGVLRGLFERGSGGLNCRYLYEPQPEGEEQERFAALFPHQTYVYGGARMLAAVLPDLQQSATEWVRDTWVAEDPAQRAVWATALPFAGLDNGDFLALDLGVPADDPPVVYLAHDDEAIVLAPSLSDYLVVWEALCYIGPEMWLLESFRHSDGQLDGSGQNANSLRALLGAT